MRKKKPIPFSQKFPNACPLALRLLERMLAFELKDRPTSEEALLDPYFKNLAKFEREPSAQSVTKTEFEFERIRITKEDVRSSRGSSCVRHPTTSSFTNRRISTQGKGQMLTM
ncbi:mitogen-activated protein kinase 16 [Tanacetum coccineum]